MLPAYAVRSGQAPLPNDIEQVAYWFQNESTIGFRISWPSSGIYQQFAAQDLLLRPGRT
jgi:hypothetical protein